MKYSKFLFFLVLFGCGRVQMGGIASNSVGETISLTAPLVSNDDRNRLTQICQALQQKEVALATSLGAQLTFAHSQTDCNGNVVSSGDLNVTIQQASGAYVFRRTDGQDFIFSSVETTSAGILAEACGNIAGFANPILSPAGTEATFITTEGILASDCPATYGESCVYVQKGIVSNGGVTITSKDWMKVRILSSNNSKIGFFTYRKKVAKSFCGNNQSVTFTASMK